MKYLVIDTETTGLFDFKLPADAPGQPRLAHLAMILVDENLAEEARTDLYVKPDGWTMPAEASAVNGLTDEFLQENGLSIRAVLDVYADEVKSGRAVVAFNAQYDLKVMRGEFRRLGLPDLFTETPNICVMRPMTALCQIPRRTGGGFKFPTLTEALSHFGYAFTDAHRAMSDAEGALVVMTELRKLGALPEAAIHYAKEKADTPPKKAAPKRRKKATEADFAAGF